MSPSRTTKRRFNVTISRSGGTVGPTSALWKEIRGGAVDLPAAPDVPDPVKAATGPIGGPTIRALVLRRSMSTGPDPAGEPLVAHVAAVLDGNAPWPLDIVVEETDMNGAQTFRRLVYREAYLQRWQVVPLDRNSKDACYEEFEFLASDLQISR